MKKSPFVTSLLSAALVCIFPFSAPAGGRHAAAYDGRVDFGSQMVYSDGACFLVDGNLSSGAFFADLQRIGVGDRFEYRRQGHVVADYPETLTTSIRLLGNQCGDRTAGPSKLLARDSYDLRFEVAWKNGMNMRPASFSVAPVACTGFNSVTIPDRGYTIPTVACQLTIDATGVPLTDHLIVSVFAADGKPMTRLSAAP
jgi:hypothetical protein